MSEYSAEISGTVAGLNALRGGKMKATRPQQNSEHLYFRMLSDALNDAGYSMSKSLIKMDVDVPWTEENVKEIIWKGIQDAMFNKESTTELNSDEVNKIYLVCDKFTSERFGIESVPFPKEEPDYSDYRSHFK